MIRSARWLPGLLACSLLLLVAGAAADEPPAYDPNQDATRRALRVMARLEEPVEGAARLAPDSRVGVVDAATGLVRLASSTGVVKLTSGLAADFETVQSVARGGVEVTLKSGLVISFGADGSVHERMPTLPAPAKLAAFERVLDVPTRELAVLGDRVAAIETPLDGYSPRAVWIVTERSKVRLEAPDLESADTLDSGHLRFDPNGALTLWMTGRTEGDSPVSGNWTWKGRWVAGKERPEPAPPAPLALAVPEPGKQPYGTSQSVAAVDARQRRWLAGPLGAFAFDAGAWWRAAELPQAVYQISTSAERIWISTSAGLYRGRLEPTQPLSATNPLCVPRPTPPPISELPPDTELLATPLAAHVERVVLPVANGAPLASASAVVATADGSLYFTDKKRLVVLKDGGARSLPPAPRFATRVDGDLLPSVSVVVEHGADAWALSCRDDDLLPAAMHRVGSTWAWAAQVPRGCYRASAFAADGSLWLAGGLRGETLGWPKGEGLIVHVTPRGSDWLRFPRSPLLAIAATAAGDVWAGGYDGQLAHVRGGKLTAYHIAEEPWILAMQALDSAVFLAGEGFVGRLRGQKLSRVPASTLPLGTWQSLALAADGALWVVGDAGIVRLSGISD